VTNTDSGPGKLEWCRSQGGPRGRAGRAEGRAECKCGPRARAAAKPHVVRRSLLDCRRDQSLNRKKKPRCRLEGWLRHGPQRKRGHFLRLPALGHCCDLRANAAHLRARESAGISLSCGSMRRGILDGRDVSTLAPPPICAATSVGRPAAAAGRTALRAGIGRWQVRRPATSKAAAGRACSYWHGPRRSDETMRSR